MTIADIITAGLLALAGVSMVSIAFSLLKGWKRLATPEVEPAPRRRHSSRPTATPAYLASEFDRR